MNDDGTPEVLHTVTQYEEENGDVHALHDFFETVFSPDGSWVGIAYQVTPQLSISLRYTRTNSSLDYFDISGPSFSMRMSSLPF